MIRNRINNDLQKIMISMGEIKVSIIPAMFTCLGLGSCVALYIYDPVMKIGGGAHIMLPDSNSEDFRKQKYADLAPRILLAYLKASGSGKENLKAKIAGGANLLPMINTNNLYAVGRHNINKIKEILIENHIPLVSEDTDGTLGRRAIFDSFTGELMICYDNGTTKII
ncbi:MAG: chemotaxis protein CheD [Bacteroidetes bacterium]|nr:chemotaxis protein CheD [Bacteroidota bacterium]